MKCALLIAFFLACAAVSTDARAPSVEASPGWDKLNVTITDRISVPCWLWGGQGYWPSDELATVTITDGSNSVFRFKFRVNQGDGDVNSGIWAYIADTYTNYSWAVVDGWFSDTRSEIVTFSRVESFVPVDGLTFQDRDFCFEPNFQNDLQITRILYYVSCQLAGV
mmetsp:Transcript_53367/g.133993  ORF Transcript_53367/g.133993 Transcript_53367/m.133993 type:complete len:166 (+) Transcript_53367:123-620(+)|eukprot:CAMPEP_0177654186 /NCGR_PEP_ID=MMETSP0447-20121125/14171_1 /TAXON_ID=0 /ORGANISM="Stygamoeba regulata, Strain BSH-02190019" /LENGTH=165 /DNA_ID=CAMNT_0019157765 /DNA_START=104 /DNA_END=601 /DNA_ORIENTATION=+